MFLIRIILFFLFLYLLLYIAGKIFAMWFRNKSRKYQNRTGYSSKKEGEITVEKPRNLTNKKFTKEEGEYISFEELDEK